MLKRDGCYEMAYAYLNTVVCIVYNGIFFLLSKQQKKDREKVERGRRDKQRLLFVRRACSIATLLVIIPPKYKLHEFAQDCTSHDADVSNSSSTQRGVAAALGGG